MAHRRPISIIDAQPEQRLAAAVLQLAVQDARGEGVVRGQARVEARDWLDSDEPLVWLALVAPPDEDILNLHSALRRMAS